MPTTECTFLVLFDNWKDSTIALGTVFPMALLSKAQREKIINNDNFLYLVWLVMHQCSSVKQNKMNSNRWKSRHRGNIACNSDWLCNKNLSLNRTLERSAEIKMGEILNAFILSERVIETFSSKLGGRNYTWNPKYLWLSTCSTVQFKLTTLCLCIMTLDIHF